MHRARALVSLMDITKMLPFAFISFLLAEEGVRALGSGRRLSPVTVPFAGHHPRAGR